MPVRLYKKKINHLSGILKVLKRNGNKITSDDLLWILKKFTYYFTLSLIHGGIMKFRNIKYRMYYEISNEYEQMEKQYIYAKTSAFYGAFFTVKSEGGFPEKFKATFKPSIYMRKIISDKLSDPDLMYSLIK